MGLYFIRMRRFFSRSRRAVYEHEFLLTYDLWVNVISPILTGDSYKYESLGKQARDTKRKAEASKLENGRQNKKYQVTEGFSQRGIKIRRFEKVRISS